MNNMNYAIVYSGGFALLSDLRALQYEVGNETEIHIRAFATAAEAYVFACQEHSKREYWRNPGMLPVMPRWEDMRQTPVFHVPGFVSQPISYRYFAAVCSDLVAILTDAENVTAFLSHRSYAEIKEFASMASAQNWLNYWFLRFIMPMMAYINDEVPACVNISVNTAYPVDFIGWIQQHCGNVPVQLQFRQPPLAQLKGGSDDENA